MSHCIWGEITRSVRIPLCAGSTWTLIDTKSHPWSPQCSGVRAIHKFTVLLTQSTWYRYARMPHFLTNKARPFPSHEIESLALLFPPHRVVAIIRLVCTYRCIVSSQLFYSIPCFTHACFAFSNASKRGDLWMEASLIGQIFYPFSIHTVFITRTTL